MKTPVTGGEVLDFLAAEHRRYAEQAPQHCEVLRSVLVVYGRDPGPIKFDAPKAKRTESPIEKTEERIRELDLVLSRLIGNTHTPERARIVKELSAAYLSLVRSLVQLFNPR